MARRYGDQSFKAGERDNLADEMADVLWVLVCLANQTGVDLTAAVEANFAKKTARDRERHKRERKAEIAPEGIPGRAETPSRKRQKVPALTSRDTITAG